MAPGIRDTNFLKNFKTTLLVNTEVYLTKYELDINDINLLTATVLDPLYKNADWLDKKSEKNALYKQIADHITKTVNFPESMSQETNESSQVLNSQPIRREVDPGLNLKDALFGSWNQRSKKDSTYTDLKKSLERDSNSPLHIYYKNKSNIEASPRLAHAIPEILIIPASSIPSERVFSHTGFQIDDRLNKLAASTVEDVMIIYENIDIVSNDDERESS